MEAASDKIRIYNVELPKFTAEYDSIDDVSGETEKENALLQWLYMLTKGYQSEEEMEMLENRNAGMANFTDLYKKANADQKLRDRYEYQMSVRLEENSRIKAAEDEGVRRVALRMYNQKHMLPEEISDMIGRPVAVVKKWLGLVRTQTN